MEGMGGIRKLRWAAFGRGKRGGVRVIYYFHSDAMPLYALDIFGKNEKDDLSEPEKRAWRAVVESILKNRRLQ